VRVAGPFSTISGASSFGNWWTKAATNVESVFSMTLSNAANPLVYTFASTSFFPAGTNAPWYTYEVHSWITYRGGEVFTFAVCGARAAAAGCRSQRVLRAQSSDDLWLFINGVLRIDLGGVHPTATGSVALDSLGLTVNQTYSFDIFYAHRGRTTTPAVTGVSCVARALGRCQLPSVPAN
jgi:fibro-slime domain-containing protein